MINPEKVALHSAELHLIPVVMTEFSYVALQHPIVFTKNEVTGEFVCSALFGFTEHENLFWQNGQWQGAYLPLQIQRQPFFINDAAKKAEANSGDYLVGIDLNSPAVVSSPTKHDDNWQRLFTDTGADSQYFQQANQCLAQLLQGNIDNQHLITQLKKLDLLQSVAVEVTFVNQQSTRLNGLYSINQDKLAALSGEQIAHLHQQQLLPAIYTMITSLGQIYPLIERKNACLTA